MRAGALNLPGRGARANEPALTEMEAVLDLAQAELNTISDKPFAFFGHSAGAVMAFALASRLERAGGAKKPFALFLSSHASASRPINGAPMYQQSTEELVKGAAEWGQLPDAVLEDEALLGSVIQTMKADFEVEERWVGHAGQPSSYAGAVDFPLVVLGGTDDPVVPAVELARWAEATLGSCEKSLFPGGHFYLAEDGIAEAVVEFVASRCAERLIAVREEALRAYEGYYFEHEVPWEQDVLVHELCLERPAAKTPTNVAVRFRGEEITFGELNARADELALHLHALGARPNRLCGIYMEHSIDFVVCYFAILKAGGGYMELSRASPAKMIAAQCEECDAVCVLTHAAIKEDLPADLRTVVLDEDGWRAGAKSTAEELREMRKQMSSDDLAFCTLSSGTTGKPKVILAPHRLSTTSYVTRQVRFGLLEGDVVASHVFFVWELARPLMHGCTLVVIPDEAIYDPERLVSVLQDNAVTQVLLTPSLCQTVLNASTGPIAEQLQSLRQLLLCGEVVSMELLRTLQKRLPHTSLYSEYSISEIGTVSMGEIRDTPDDAPYAHAGTPDPNVLTYVLDEQLNPVPRGYAGELYVGGNAIGLGYLNLPGVTAERFVDNPFAATKQKCPTLFRTGDRAVMLQGQRLELHGRVAFMLKLRGFTVVPGAIESAICAHSSVDTALVVPEIVGGNCKRLIAYVVHEQGAAHVGAAEMKRFLQALLPAHEVPAVFITLDQLPTNAISGKVDRKQLPLPPSGQGKAAAGQPSHANDVESKLTKQWATLLGLDIGAVARDVGFYDLGGHSLLVATAARRASAEFGVEVGVLDLFQFSTISTLAAHVQYLQDKARPAATTDENAQTPGAAPPETRGHEVALVGIACRFPDADSPDAFWQNLADGVESVRELSTTELLAAGVAEEMFSRDDYVRCVARLDNLYDFDAERFGLSRKEVSVMDPQHRLFLEGAVHALEDAAHDPERDSPKVGVYGGCWRDPAGDYQALLPAVSSTDLAEQLLRETGNDKDYMPSRVAFLLGLTGPAVAVQTSCSTGLSCIAAACSAITTQQCDLALAGASSICFGEKGTSVGYLHYEGMPFSADGRCRAFDSRASGTVFGDGCGVAVLKPKDCAVQDHNTIRAVIRGFGINNDGKRKVGYAAPSMQGQEDVICSALSRAGVPARSISYIEAHGTGTTIGDPLEFAALTRAFRRSTADEGFCTIGSVKPNVGHSNIAAGMAGLIKTAMALNHREIPPLVNFTEPNPAIQVAGSPFVFAGSKLQQWDSPKDDEPRRAGVSCFGVGGTNVHMILEEGPEQTAASDESTASTPARESHVIALSAGSAAALRGMKDELAKYLSSSAPQLADVAYTLQVGRTQFAQHRLALTARSKQEAVIGLLKASATECPDATDAEVVMVFPGQGAQHVNLSLGLYREEPGYRRLLDKVLELFEERLGYRLQQCLFPAAADDSSDLDSSTLNAQCVLFCVEWAMASLWLEWGIRPRLLVGHSIGEIVAATLSGVFGLEDAVTVVVARGRAMQTAATGAMVSVDMTAEEAMQLADKTEGLHVAANNSPRSCVLAGTEGAVADISRQLSSAGHDVRSLHCRHAFHTPQMACAADEFIQTLHDVSMSPPQLPFASNVFGRTIQPEEATDPEYWRKHLLQPVLFAQCIESGLGTSSTIILHVGPDVLQGPIRQTAVAARPNAPALRQVSSARRPAAALADNGAGDARVFGGAVAQLWELGVNIDWAAHNSELGRIRQRVSVPGYQFHRECIGPPEVSATVARPAQPDEDEVARWMYRRSFEACPAQPRVDRSVHAGSTVLLCCRSTNDVTLANQVAAAFGPDARVFRVRVGPRFDFDFDGSVGTLRASSLRTDFLALFTLLQLGRGQLHVGVCWEAEDLWQETEAESVGDSVVSDSVVALAQAVVAFGGARQLGSAAQVTVFTRGVFAVSGEELPVDPAAAAVMGAVLTIPQELPSDATCQLRDLGGKSGRVITATQARLIASELAALKRPEEIVVARRGQRRWRMTYSPLQTTSSEVELGTSLLLGAGALIVTGGLGRIGLALAERIASLHPAARLVLLTRRAQPNADATALCARFPEQVEVVTARNLTDAREFSQILCDANQRHDGIAGVLHLAGLADLQFVGATTAESIAKELQPKLTVGEAIAAAINLPGAPEVPFVALFSSLAAVLGGYGMTGYAGANATLDALAEREQAQQWLREELDEKQTETRWVSVAWDDWDFQYGKEQTALYEKANVQTVRAPYR